MEIPRRVVSSNNASSFHARVKSSRVFQLAFEVVRRFLIVERQTH